ncbi:hypothetical protein [Aliikangiella maris]|uniref:Uncharacterized protein n=2 Tax=Aliikangiella maris TaxID=3162458 RepID=A0ABV3MTS4_9GAMM
MKPILISIILLFFCGNLFAIEITKTEKTFTATNYYISNSQAAEMWKLSESDIEAYKLIMAGPRGNFSPGIAPPLALALETDNKAERIKYLTIYAQLEYERTQKDLAVSQLYRKIFDDLYSGPVIKTDMLFSKNEEYIRPGDRFVVFIDNNCNDCKLKILNDLIKTSNFPNNPTDIYVKGLSGESELHAWASANSIKVEDVQKGLVTLNLMQSNTMQFLETTDYAIFVLRNDSLFSFYN